MLRGRRGERFYFQVRRVKRALCNMLCRFEDFSFVLGRGSGKGRGGVGRTGKCVRTRRKGNKDKGFGLVTAGPHCVWVAIWN